MAWRSKTVPVDQGRRNVLTLLAGGLALASCSTSDALRPNAPVVVQPLATDKYAAIVVEAGSGRVLYAANADQPRYPASLTKMMTMLMLFEAIDRGSISRSTRIPVSAYAAARPPSKLGVKAGETIDVDTALRALATRSANDVAAAVGEYFSGSEQQFAAAITRRGRELGLTSTVFRNASGLPDPDKRTTARDMARLGAILCSRYAHHYGYFGEREFAYQGRMVRGHNTLLGRVAGVDGIKTGYTRASGFNIVTAVQRGGKRYIIVVLGGESAASRNDHVEALIARYVR